MEPQLSWQADWHTPSAIRLALQRSARISHHIFSIVGFVVITSLCALWLRPQWRDTFATRLAPFFAAAAQTQDSLDPLFSDTERHTSGKSFNAHAKHSAGSAYSFDTPTAPLFASLARKVSSDRIAAEARDDRIFISAHEQARVANYLARRYHVAQEPMRHLVRVAFQTGREVGLDPLLLLAVMAIESRFNPFAESGWGAQGLMQVLSRVHGDKLSYFGGSRAALEPFANIKVGAIVLRDCIVRSGSLTNGLRRYVGASTSGRGSGYGVRVLAERARLREATRSAT